MAEEPGAAESLPGAQGMNVRSLGRVSPELMDTQKTHLHTREGMCE